MNCIVERFSWWRQRLLSTVLIMLAPMSQLAAQGISFFPNIDSLCLWGTCTPPGIVCHTVTDSSNMDRVVIHPYAAEFIRGTPPYTIIARYDSVYFEIRDSLHQNRYELWYTNLSPYHPIRIKVPSDSLIYIFPGHVTFTLFVLHNSSLVDSSLVNGYSVQTGLGVDDVHREVPLSLQLHHNYPNPFNGGTTIAYSLPVSGHVTVQVSDVLGRSVATLEDRYQFAGSHMLYWEPGALSSGSYFVAVSIGLNRSVIRCQFIK